MCALFSGNILEGVKVSLGKDNENIKFLYKEITNAIDYSKRNVVTAINSEMVVLYWNIGKILKTEILQSEKAEYGKGYSQRNLFNMVRCFETFYNEQILQTLSAKLSWSHLVKLFYIEDDLKREFYIIMCNNERWSVRTLTDRINSMLYERTAISKKPELTIVNDLKQLSEKNKITTDLFLEILMC